MNLSELELAVKHGAFSVLFQTPPTISFDDDCSSSDVIFHCIVNGQMVEIITIIFADYLDDEWVLDDIEITGINQPNGRHYEYNGEFDAILKKILVPNINLQIAA